jgi:predicted nucleic acid-binding protein
MTIARVQDARLLELPLDPIASRRIGTLAQATSAKDVVDGHVAMIALERDAVVVTSDPEDMARWGVAESKIIVC